jgi:hypothetical protein
MHLTEVLIVYIFLRSKIPFHIIYHMFLPNEILIYEEMTSNIFNSFSVLF